MEEKNLSDNLLQAEIARIMQNSDVYNAMVSGAKGFAKPGAAHEMVRLITQVAKEH